MTLYRILAIVIALGGLTSAKLILADERFHVFEVRIRNLPLVEGERIAAIQVEVAGARFHTVHIPRDWGVDISPPVSGVSVLTGGAQHGVAMLASEHELRRFVMLATYSSGRHEPPPSVKVELELYRYDARGGETTRTLILDGRQAVLQRVAESSPPANRLCAPGCRP